MQNRDFFNANRDRPEILKKYFTPEYIEKMNRFNESARAMYDTGARVLVDR